MLPVADVPAPAHQPVIPLAVSYILYAPCSCSLCSCGGDPRPALLTAEKAALIGAHDLAEGVKGRTAYVDGVGRGGVKKCQNLKFKVNFLFQKISKYFSIFFFIEDY